MPQVNFITHDGSVHTVDVPVGTTLMRAATDNGVPGIDGDCGGQCACATCHVYIEAPWDALTGERTTQLEMNICPLYADASALVNL